MRVYIVKLNTMLKLIGLICVVTFFTIFFFCNKESTISVSNDQRELPIYCVDYNEKKIALTFDCAWESDDIPDILKTLDSENVKATFFIVADWAQKYPQAVKAISQAGHDIGNHSYSHPKMSHISDDKIRKEITMCDNVLQNLIGKNIDLFRAPYGEYNDNVVKIAKELNHYTIQWDVDSLDWKPGISKEEIKKRVFTKVKPGSILLFHNDTPYTAELLPQILSELKANGYGFLPVSEFILRENYYLDYEGRQRKK